MPSISISTVIILFWLFNSISLHAQKRILDGRMHHLRKGAIREWSEFPVNAYDTAFTLNFNLTSTPAESCLFLRQYDVNQSWVVTLNGKKLGELVVDEKDMITAFNVPPGSLRRTNNQIRISSAVTGANSDDIKVGQVEFYPHSLKKILSETNLDIEIKDRYSSNLIPSRLTVVDQNKSLRPVDIKPADDIATRTGVIYTGKGKLSFNLPSGNYTIYATRGFEYGVDSFKVLLKSGSKTKKTFFIAREIDTDGWISCDPHIHAYLFRTWRRIIQRKIAYDCR